MYDRIVKSCAKIASPKILWKIYFSVFKIAYLNHNEILKILKYNIVVFEPAWTSGLDLPISLIHFTTEGRQIRSSGGNSHLLKSSLHPFQSAISARFVLW